MSLEMNPKYKVLFLYHFHIKGAIQRCILVVSHILCFKFFVFCILFFSPQGSAHKWRRREARQQALTNPPQKGKSPK